MATELAVSDCFSVLPPGAATPEHVAHLTSISPWSPSKRPSATGLPLYAWNAPDRRHTRRASRRFVGRRRARSARNVRDTPASTRLGIRKDRRRSLPHPHRIRPSPRLCLVTRGEGEAVQTEAFETPTAASLSPRGG